ncbi:unnamed protein product [Phytophthora lilii]|uniref:Unnamed protein product n=1 Tax=Phytophthora lilii TaxID=2077276 RepID=A0A9W6TYN3_9STRA|nr:unnamed protein product [Phytophthora lilii]
MISPSSENYDETMSTLRYAESAKKVMNRAVVNEDKNARIIRQLRQEIEELRAQLARKEGSPGKERINAGISASLVERESFYAELQQEVEFFRSQQKQLAETASPRAIHLSDSLPSLVNMSANLVPGEALAYVLVEGTTLFGSDPHPDVTKYETVEVQHDQEESEEKSSEDSEAASKPPKPKKRHGSWTSTILRRRKSSSRSAPSTPSGKSPRKRSNLDASEVAFALSADKRAIVQVCELPGDDVSRILPRHARFTCTRVPIEQKAVTGEEDTTEYVVELESLDPTAIVQVNGQPLEYGSEHPTKLHHGDQVRLGKPFCFRIHGKHPAMPSIAEAVEQPPELQIDEDEGRKLEALVEEANSICTKWVLNTEFAVAKDISDGSKALGTVIVKKKLEANCCSTVHWDRTMLELKLQFLREFAASLENVVSFTVEEAPKIEDLQIPEPAPKVAVPRLPSSLSEHERKPSRSDDKSVLAKHEHSVMSKPQTRSMPSLRLLGYGRVYLAAQPQSSFVALSVAIYDFSGAYIGMLDARLEGVSAVTLPGKKRGILSPKELAIAVHRIRVHLDKMKFDAQNFLDASGISVTLKETASKANAELKLTDGKEILSEETSTPKIFSTPRVPPAKASNEEVSTAGVDGHHNTFIIGESFETTITAKKDNIFSQRTAEEESLLVEVWGYDVKLARNTAPLADKLEPASDTQQVEFYVSVDVEERDVDGLYHPVAVKPDGALRLHANRSRRLMVRVTQSDQQPFALSEIVHVRIAAPDAPSVNRTASMSRMMGKTTQRMLPSSRMLYEHSDQSSSAASGESQFGDLGPTRWQVLDFRGNCNMDETSRSLSAVLRWDRAPDSDLEPLNTAGSRSTYRLAIAFTTQWSKVPIVISKSLVAKVCGSRVSAAQRFTRGLVASRTVWWAKESFSRSYRLGTWYAADIMVDDTSLDGGNNDGDSQPEGTGEAASVNDIVIAHHISGLHRLEIAMQLERVRQKAWIMMNLRIETSAQDDNNDTSHAVGEQLTAPKVNLCLDEVFQRTEDEVQVFESVQFDSPELYLRHLRRTDLLMVFFTGKLVDLYTVKGITSSSENPIVSEHLPLKFREHIIHFVSEPTQLVDGDQLGGEMSGFLMLSLSSSLDEETAAAVVAPLGSNVVWPKTPPKGGNHHVTWERQWFVLKRPFLYAYESFARKQQTGVMDLSLCQLIVSTAPDVPFSFRLVCVDGRKQSAVWWLQASTSSEMRAWLVAIDPLKIEAREGVASTPPAAEAPALTA